MFRICYTRNPRAHAANNEALLNINHYQMHQALHSTKDVLTAFFYSTRTLTEQFVVANHGEIIPTIISLAMPS